MASIPGSLFFKSSTNYFFGTSLINRFVWVNDVLVNNVRMFGQPHLKNRALLIFNFAWTRPRTLNAANAMQSFPVGLWGTNIQRNLASRENQSFFRIVQTKLTKGTQMTLDRQNDGLFYCPQESCDRSFSKPDSLSKHCNGCQPPAVSDQYTLPVREVHSSSYRSQWMRRWLVLTISMRFVLRLTRPMGLLYVSNAILASCLYRLSLISNNMDISMRMHQKLALNSHVCPMDGSCAKRPFNSPRLSQVL